MALILCNGMNRSGSTLQYNLARMLVETTGAGSGESFLSQEELDGHKAQLEAWAADGRLHILKTHDLSPTARQLWENGSLRVLYIHRDIRDVAASMKRIWDYQGETLIPHLDQAIETYHAVRRMEKGVLRQRYEDVMADHQAAVLEIAEFLDIAISAEQAAQIADECSASKMRKVQEQHKKVVEEEKARRKKLSFFRRVLRKLGIKKGAAARKNRQFEPVTGLHGNHIGENEGGTGAWQSILSSEEKQLITGRYGAWLQEEGYLQADG